MKKWAGKHDCCIECRTIDYKHLGNGLCRKCYKKQANAKFWLQYKKKIGALEIAKKTKAYYNKHKKVINVRRRELYHAKPLDERIMPTKKYVAENREIINLRRRISRKRKKHENILKSWIGLKISQEYE